MSERKPINISPGTYGSVEVRIEDGPPQQFRVLMWMSGNTMSTVEPGHVRYFERDQRMGPNVWTLKGRPVEIELLNVDSTSYAKSVSAESNSGGSNG